MSTYAKKSVGEELMIFSDMNKMLYVRRVRVGVDNKLCDAAVVPMVKYGADTRGVRQQEPVNLDLMQMK